MKNGIAKRLLTSLLCVMLAAALFVWSVLTTRWPVMEAVTAMLAVSSSRISPIIMISGSCLSMERSADANVRSALEFTWTWFMPSISTSTGSSTVTMFTSGLFISLMAL